MQLSRPISKSRSILALLALSLGCMRCSSDATNMALDSGAGTSSSAGARAENGGRASDESSDQAGVGGSSNDGASQAGFAGESAGQGGADSEATDQIPTFNGCSPADYEDRSTANSERIIGIATEGLTFTPRCLTILVGQSVRWQGSLSSHPLAPGNPDDPNAGSADSPIVATSGGQSVEFTFGKAGTFPYFCELHSFADGQGMAGVVHVKP